MTSTGAPQDAVAWRICASGIARTFAFADGVMVFNPLSWETHIVNESAALILEALARSPRSLDELTRVVAEEGPDLEHARHAVQLVLENMESLGLVASEPRHEVRR